MATKIYYEERTRTLGHENSQLRTENRDLRNEIARLKQANRELSRDYLTLRAQVPDLRVRRDGDVPVWRPREDGGYDVIEVIRPPVTTTALRLIEPTADEA